MTSFFAKFNCKKSSVPAHNVFDERECNDVFHTIDESTSISDSYERDNGCCDYEHLQETILGEVSASNYHALCFYN